MKLGDTQYRYTPDIGIVPEGEEARCGVCGDLMNERRNCLGARGFAQAMAGSKSNYDEFLCPNHLEKWHEQVVALRQEIKKTPSRTLAILMEQEVKDILENREPTK